MIDDYQDLWALDQVGPVQFAVWPQKICHAPENIFLGELFALETPFSVKCRKIAEMLARLWFNVIPPFSMLTQHYSVCAEWFCINLHNNISQSNNN